MPHHIILSMDKYKIALSGIIILFIGAGFFSLNNLFLYTPDSARYAAWANSLSQFKGFTDYTSPESARYVVHSPLYSLLLSPLAFLAPSNIVALKILNLLLSAGTMVLLYLIVNKKRNPIVALTIVGLYALHPFVFIFSTQILTEILFGFFFLLLIYLLSREKDETALDKNYYLILFTVLGNVFSREIGILTVFIVSGFFIYRKHYTKAIIVFFVPIIFYSGWYIRNEIYYGSLESPDLRNSSLFLSNYYTTVDSSYAAEIWMRVINNFQFYLKEVTKLVFLSPYKISENSFNAPWMLLVNQQSVAVNFTVSFIGKLYWIIAPLSMALVGLGMFVEIRRERDWYVKFIFLGIYFGIILVYPVIDPRFLFPIFLLFLLWIAAALHYLFQLNVRILRSFILIIIILSLPNILWSINFIDTQHRLYQDPLGSFMDSDNPSIHINHRQIVEPVAAEWLNQQNDSTAVVLFTRKELSLFLKNSKVILLRELASLHSFNNTIRDYNIKYIVCGKDITGWRNYEYQMGLNKEYSFERVFEKGSIEIYRVNSFSPGIKNIGRYANIFEATRVGNDSAVNEYFTHARSLMAGHPDLMYWAMVNKHIIGELDSVQYFADKLYTLPQGLMYSRKASMHLTVINRRKQLAVLTTKQQRSDILLTLGVNYWELDMDRLSAKFLKKCLEEDSSYALAYIYNIVFAFHAQDTSYAYHVSQKLIEKFSSAELSQKVAELIQAYNGFRSFSNPKQKAAFLEKIFDGYEFLGFHDFAIDNGLLSLRYDPKRESMYFKLGLAYDKLNKHFSSLTILQKGKLIDGSHQVDSLLQVQKTKLYFSTN